MKHTPSVIIKKAQKLYIEKGCTDKEIAYFLCVEKRTVQSWIYTNKWKVQRDAIWLNNDALQVKDYPGKELEPVENRKLKAQLLFVEKGYDVKEIVAMLDTPEREVRQWIADGKWNELKTKQQYMLAGVSIAAIESKPVQEPKEVKRAKAHLLFVEKLCSAKEIADILQMKYGTVREWIKDNNWETEKSAKTVVNAEIDLSTIEAIEPAENMQAKQFKARYLMLVKSYNQKETAKLVGVSEKTMTQWVKAFRWKEETPKAYNVNGGLSALMEGFVKYVQQKDPKFATPVLKLWGAYLQSLENDLNDS